MEDAGTLDGEQKVVVKGEIFKATSRVANPAREPAGHPARSAGGQRKQEEKKKRKEEKSCLLSCWCCEEGKEGHGQPGAVGVQRPGTAGAAEGRGRLPSPHSVPAIAAFPPPGKRSRSFGMREQERHHPLRCSGRGDPALKQLSLLPLSEAV